MPYDSCIVRGGQPVYPTEPGTAGPLIPEVAQQEIIKGANRSTVFRLIAASEAKRFVTIKGYMADPNFVRPKKAAKGSRRK